MFEMAMFKRLFQQKTTLRTASLVATITATASLAIAAASGPSLRVIIFGGGPTPESNQVAIENNVKWMMSILPEWSNSFVMFGDGTTTTETVQISPVRTKAHKVLASFFGDAPTDVSKDTPIAYRPSSVSRIDAASKKASIDAAFGRLEKDRSKDPVFLYFTGHGSRGRTGFDTNRYDLWREEGITPAELVTQLQRVKKGVPVTILMVQCFSGAFANVIFDGANEQNELLDRQVCGFFAATPDRVAAGCTPELNEAEYRDFSSTFLAAITGKDRVGRTVQMPDYNGNGWTGFDEAYYFSLIEDPSIDVPVVTSDAFLRKFVPVTDDNEVAATPWADVLKWANPAQRAALVGMCDKIGGEALTEKRFEVALSEFRRRGRQGDAPTVYSTEVREELGRAVAQLSAQFPNLSRRGGGDPNLSRVERGRAVQYLQANPDILAGYLKICDKLDAAQDAAEADAVRGARWIRLLRLGKSVVLEHRLREGKDRGLIKRFEALRKLESGNPLRS
jgi:hypothetical protein